MRGQVLGLDGGEGAIAGADGNRYRFAAADLRRQRVAVGGIVDFVVDGEAARDIYPLGEPGEETTPLFEGAPSPDTATPGRPEPDRSLLAYFFRATTDDYARFRGRARRKEYWGYALFYCLILLLLGALLAVGIRISNLGMGPADMTLSPLVFLASGLLTLFLFGMICPSLAVTARRLHDIGVSGWWQLLMFVPVLGTLILLVMTLIASDRQANVYGPPVVPTR
jgi:uncharacterized membrane protein YhaH (DUF805 family)